MRGQFSEFFLCLAIQCTASYENGSLLTLLKEPQWYNQNLPFLQDFPQRTIIFFFLVSLSHSKIQYEKSETPPNQQDLNIEPLLSTSKRQKVLIRQSAWRNISSANLNTKVVRI